MIREQVKMFFQDFQFDIFDILIWTVYFVIVCLICKIIADVVKDMVDKSVIKCVFDKIKVADSDEIVYGCKIGSGIVFNKEKSRINKINGKHFDELLDDDVQAITIETSPETIYFPSGFGGVFKNVVQIKINNTRISEITQDHLMDFPKLKYLYLNNNEIKTIDKELFKFNPELEVIDLSFNRISHVSKDAFKGLNKLRFLDLRENIVVYDHATNKEDVATMIQQME